MYIKLRSYYRGWKTSERVIPAGTYQVDDEAIFGIADYLVNNGHAEYIQVIEVPAKPKEKAPKKPRKSPAKKRTLKAKTIKETVKAEVVEGKVIEVINRPLEIFERVEEPEVPAGDEVIE